MDSLTIYITGDTHAALNNESGLYKKGHKLRKDFIKSLNPNDILIVLGDFGYTWTPDILKQYSCPAITLAVDGNHDNFTYLNSCPKIEMFGSEVGVIKDNVYRLLSGNIYNIEGIFLQAVRFMEVGRLPHDREQICLYYR